MVPLTLLAAASAVYLLWKVVFSGGTNPLAGLPRRTATQAVPWTPGVTPAATNVDTDPTSDLLPSPTSTVLPPPTGAPTLSPSPGPSSTPSPFGQVAGTGGEVLNLRTGPGTNYEVVLYLHEGTTVLVLGRDATDSWLNVRTSEGQQGWVARQYIANDMPSERLPVYTPGPTPLPTATPEPDPHFAADRLEITRGECTRLWWDIDGVSTVYLEGNGVAGKGALDVCPTETKTYTLRVVQSDGISRDRTVTIRVLVPTTSADYTLDARGCIAHDMQLGQVKGQVFDREGKVVVNAVVTITIDGQAGVVPPGRTNEAGWYEFNLKDGQTARFVALEVAGQPAAFAPPNYEVKARSGCYQRVDFRQN